MNTKVLHATVVGTTRKFATLFTSAHEQIMVRLFEKHKDLTVGDQVIISPEKEDYIIQEIAERRNHLSRSYFDKQKKLVSNIDLLFIVTAVGDLYNPVFIDRVLVSAAYEQIRCHLIVNKIDKDSTNVDAIKEDYKAANIAATFCSAKQGIGLESLQTIMEDSETALVAFCGMSGVGKSTLLNKLCPEAGQHTQEVSEKTGQGKQTTSQALGYPHLRQGKSVLMVVDLPGIQSFGMSDFTVQTIGDGFAEIVSLRSSCEYRNCSHTAEEKCSVKAAVESAVMPVSRYNSYIHMLDEMTAQKKYS